jgi:hypothetical protein
MGFDRVQANNAIDPLNATGQLTRLSDEGVPYLI